MQGKDLRNSITILVCSCDRYGDCWEPFFKLLKTYWPAQEPMPRIILNTESRVFHWDGLDIECLSLYQPGEQVPYGQRLLAHLQAIDTEFVLPMLDDFFVRRTIDVDCIKAIVDKMQARPKIAAVYFDKSRYLAPEDELLPGFPKIARYAMFKLNMQAAVWRTEKLKSYWQPQDTPWEWEVFATYTAFDTDDMFYAIDEWAHAPVYYGYNPDGMGIFRGKWVIEDVQPLFEAHGIEVPFDHLGTYDASSVASLFPNLPQTMAYMLRRVKLRYFLGFACFNLYKQFLLRLGKKPRLNNHIDYLYERERQRTIRAQRKSC